MRKFKGFQFDTFEITLREIIASVVIVGLMFLIGFTISGNIDNYIMDQNEEYNRAAKIESNDMFQYGMETDLGNAFVYGKIKPFSLVILSFSAAPLVSKVTVYSGFAHFA